MGSKKILIDICVKVDASPSLYCQIHLAKIFVHALWVIDGIMGHSSQIMVV